MPCGRARRLLWPDAGLRAVSPEVEAAERHVAGCEGCRAFLEEMRHTAAVVRDLAPRPEAPRTARNRLFQAIARARTGSSKPRHPRVAKWAGLAAAIALAASLAVVWGSRGAAGPDPIAGLAEDHMRATRGEGLVSSDSAVVAGWLASRLPFAMDVPRLPSLELRGARLCLMDGRRGGVVEYSAAGRLVSYFVVPSWPAGRAPARGEVHVTSRQGFHVAAWQEPGLVHALVGDLPEATLAELARLCMAKMMALLAWGGMVVLIIPPCLAVPTTPAAVVSPGRSDLPRTRVPRVGNAGHPFSPAGHLGRCSRCPRLQRR